MSGSMHHADSSLRPDLLTRRRMLTGAAGLTGAAIAETALADSLADVPPRGPGAPLSGMSERSSYVHISRVPELTPGKRDVDPSVAINSKAPLDKLVGSITPA